MFFLYALLSFGFSMFSLFMMFKSMLNDSILWGFIVAACGCYFGIKFYVLADKEYNTSNAYARFNNHEELKVNDYKQLQKKYTIKRFLINAGFALLLIFGCFQMNAKSYTSSSSSYSNSYNYSHDEWHNYDGSSIVCRHNGCGKTPLYSDWEIRFCSEHIKGDKKCRHPECSERIPMNSKNQHCPKHRNYDHDK